MQAGKSPRKCVAPMNSGQDHDWTELMALASRGRIIVVGNEKGGTGKSTTAMHLIVGALRDGLSVASVDLDAGQASLSRYISNRRSFAEQNAIPLAMPAHYALPQSDSDSRNEAELEDRGRLGRLLAGLANDYDVTVVDCPGNDTVLARTAIAFSDTLITPINDSFLDLDLIARFEGDPPQPVAPSRYSEAIWEQRKARASSRSAPIDWVVLRNRLSTLQSHNQRNVEAVLSQLAERFGFRLADGFNERVVFRELFVQGLTVLDLREGGAGIPLNMSHVAARQEVRRLLDFVGLRRSPVRVRAPADATV